MKHALVTGSTKGIGKAIGLELLRQGCAVAFNYARDDDSAAALADELEGAGYAGMYRIIKADLSTFEGLELLMEGLGPEFETLDYLILNAGSTVRGSLEQLRVEDWERVLRMNLTIPLFLVQRCASRMRPEGCILFIGSMLGQLPHALSIPYGTSKAAVHYLTKSLVKEFVPRRVRVNCVCPGFVETEWQANKPAEIRQSIENKIALHRFAEPEEIAHLACSVLQNTYINGSLVNIDGGYCYR